MDEPEEGSIEADATNVIPRISVAGKISASPQTLLLVSHFFSAWGDRMWMFAIGLYLVELTPNSLRLTAIYGLAVSLTVVLFGSMIGHWVDVNSRLKVIRISLFVQNLLVCLSALVILAILFRKPGQPAVLKACEAAIIILGSASNIASQASTIAIERDWIVVVAADNKDFLAGINSKMRRIDLSCALLAPVGVGLLMTLVSNVAGIIFICSWNIISFFAEYYLLIMVYRSVPRLALKHSASEPKENIRGSVESLHGKDEFSQIVEQDDTNLIEQYEESGCLQKAFHRVRSFWSGWAIYFKQNVALAGTSLAFLYLTVLGFSSVTTGYVYTQKISGAVLSVCYGVGSVFGIVGTFLFPRIRKKVGLVKTGLISFLMQWSMLALCVISIWTPGSPSDLYPKHNHIWEKTPSKPQNSHSISPSSTPPNNHPGAIIGPLFPIMTANFTTPPPKRQEETFSYASISLFLTGIILSRAGLWVTDLTVTQLLQENVAERERGIVSGTQSSFNAVLDLAHYVMTIVMPKPNQFGTLTLISFAAVTLGYIIYVCFFCLKSKELLSKGRDIVSVSSLEWTKRNRSYRDETECRGLTSVDEDEEEIVRGMLRIDSEDSTVN